MIPATSTIAPSQYLVMTSPFSLSSARRFARQEAPTVDVDEVRSPEAVL
jgi:hypothetical protein